MNKNLDICTAILCIIAAAGCFFFISKVGASPLGLGIIALLLLVAIVDVIAAARKK